MSITKHLIIMNLKKLFLLPALLFAACGTIRPRKSLPTVVSGLRTALTQNSLAALVRADSIHCYGSEFDVWLTTDNQLVVNRDATFKSVTMQRCHSQGMHRRTTGQRRTTPYPATRKYLDKAKSLKNPPILPD